MPARDGLLVVISGPAGGGKTTLVNNLVRANPNGHIRRSITATTRPPRPGEQHGVDYHFLSKAEFKAMADNGEFLEYTVFNNHYYGTPRRLLEDNVAKGGVVLLVIEVDGAESIKHFFPAAVFIFIIPPTPDELRRRLVGRGTESADDIANRLTIARREMQRLGEYDFLIINDNMETATLDLAAVIRAAERSIIVGDELALWEQGAYKDWITTRHSSRYSHVLRPDGCSSEDT